MKKEEFKEENDVQNSSESQDVDDVEDNEDQTFKKLPSAAAWSRENYINNKAMGMALASAKEIEKMISQHRIWKLSKYFFFFPTRD